MPPKNSHYYPHFHFSCKWKVNAVLYQIKPMFENICQAALRRIQLTSTLCYWGFRWHSSLQTSAFIYEDTEVWVAIKQNKHTSLFLLHCPNNSLPSHESNDDMICLRLMYSRFCLSLFFLACINACILITLSATVKQPELN